MASRTKSDPASSATERIASECLAVRARMLNRVLTGIYDEAMRPFGVTVGQVNILVSVNTFGSAGQSDVGALLHMEKSTLSRNVDRLRRGGWMRVTEDADARSQRLHVTAKGKRLIESVLPAWEAAQKEARAVVGTDGEHALRAVADRLWRDAADSK